MLQIISKNDSKIVINPQNTQKSIDMINSYIKSGNCENMTVDISRLNVMDACMVSTLCSTQHYLKYPNGKINWLTSSNEVKTYTSSMDLGNTSFSIV